MKILLNKCYGGFSFSKFFVEQYNRLYPESTIYPHSIEYRLDPKAIDLVERIGCKMSSGTYSSLYIETFPDGLDYKISDYDGIESISFSLPHNAIIQDLVDIIKGRITEPKNKFTKMLMEQDLPLDIFYEKLMMSKYKPSS